MARSSRPVIALLSPKPGASVVEGTSFTLAADASGAASAPVVEFWREQQLLTSLSSPPYRFQLAVPTDAADFTVHAVARDVLGIVETSPVTVHVLPDTPPAVAIAKPVDTGDELVPGSSLDVLVAAADDVAVASVSLLVDGVVFGTTTLPPYRFDVQVSTGATEMRLRASATDTIGQVTQTAETVFRIADSDPGTTAVGRVLSAAHAPVAGAQVTCGGEAGTTDADGAFTIGSIPGSIPALTCTANAVGVNGERLTGRSQPIPIVLDGITAIDDIVLRQFSAYLYPGPRIPLRETPRSIGIGDFDDDGTPDIAVTRFEVNSPRLEVLRTGDDGLYQTASLAASRVVATLEVGDFNRDQRADVCVAPGPLLSIATHLGNGNGTFQPQVVTSAFEQADNPNRFAVADLNADGALDVFVRRSSYVGRGDGSFQSTQVLFIPFFDTGIALGDVDDDDVEDLVAVTGDTLNRVSQYSVYRGVGDGSFLFVATTAMSGNPRGVAIADVTGDGRNDLVMRRLQNPTLVLLEGHGDGSFGAPQSLSGTDPFAGSFSVQAPRVTDLDGDSRMDVVADSGLNVAVFRGAGTGQFESPVRTPIGGDGVTGQIRIADVDLDGALDVVVANGPTSGGGTKDLSILYGLGGGALDSYRSTNAGAQPSALAAGDLDGDGDLDMVVTNEVFFNATASVLIGRGDGSFMAPAPYSLGTGVSWPAGIALADLDGDEALDAVIAVDQSVIVLRGNGDGTLAAPVAHPAGGARGLTLADLDRDHVLDAVVVNSTDVSILYGRGDGSFEPEQRLPTGYAGGVTAGDLDGSGSLDLAVTRTDVDSVALFYGQAGRAFSAGPQLPVGRVPTAVRIADLDRAGGLDLVVSNSNSGNMSVLLSDGAGGFLPQVRYAIRTSSTLGDALAFDLVDADLDGDVDLAFTSTFESTVSLFVGRGNGTFDAAQVFGIGSCPMSITAGDVDGDSLPDLLLNNECTGTQNLQILRHR